jgi:hypothetical protein
MLLLMALLWSNAFYLNRYTSSLQMRKEGQESNIHRGTQVILAYQWKRINGCLCLTCFLVVIFLTLFFRPSYGLSSPLFFIE